MQLCSKALLVGGLAACSALAYAEEEAASPFSANVTLATDYTFRGISQTDENFAIQGGFDFKHPSGFWAGTWASNVDFGSDANIEVDLYAGFSKALPNGLGFDVAYYHYNYPNANTGIDYNEVMVGGSYKIFNVKAWYSDDYAGGTDESWYVEGNANLSLPMEVGLGLHVGYQEIGDNELFGTPDYTDWKVSVSKTVAGFGLAVSYVDTDIDEEDCLGGLQWCDPRVVFSISKTM
jgi:uncharacterized protein (TIGR02001 family)